MREMKDSGIAWLGLIPADWTCSKQKYVISLINGRAYSDKEFEEDGKYRILRVGNLFSNPVWYTSSMELPSEKYCENGDLLYSWSMSYGPVIWIGEKVIYHYHIWKVNLSSRIDKQFSYYYLMALTNEIRAEVHETTMSFVTMGIMNNSYIVYPNIYEQRAIATFLDAKCVEIEQIAADIQSEINTLEEYRSSVISESVTHGLDSSAQMKESGAQWNPTIPAHWEMVPSKYLFHDSDLRKQKSDEQLTASQKYGIITQQDYMERENASIVLANKGLEDWKHVEPYDFIISLRSFQGGLEMSEVTGCITWHYIVLKPSRPICHRYYKWLFKSAQYINALQGTCNFIRDGQDLRFSNFAQVPLFAPPMEEQEAIADYLDQKTAAIDAAIEEKTAQLVTLEEYKKSLIFEYVTGKKEVPA